MNTLQDDKAFLRMQGLTRPQLLILAQKRKLVAAAFDAFRARVYPTASQDQIREMRICFFAGAAELLVMQVYGYEIESGSDDATQEDIEFIENLYAEVAEFHEKIVAQSLPVAGRS